MAHVGHPRPGARIERQVAGSCRASTVGGQMGRFGNPSGWSWIAGSDPTLGRGSGLPGHPPGIGRCYVSSSLTWMSTLSVSTCRTDRQPCRHRCCVSGLRPRSQRRDHAPNCVASGARPPRPAAYRNRGVQRSAVRSTKARGQVRTAATAPVRRPRRLAETRGGSTANSVARPGSGRMKILSSSI